ncbi:bifunctional phosphoribosylaminoimidazolecarboxamide formyltransferase/IMP cyclohydrolase [Blattabacterium cuenoti]|uniref:bifunctional phosphoribosylaminoimidazolecarboxamide formyltransferase/IMP cyclohydrolase n=1 Tax=Blattabacterium cuenoti TaxID=1653831 RepID=UPI00163BA9AA|nr:bifunctional phosphoribosylaminoimidazolecarboxamide formyltransferase/IMP cyclohydrolase [Blattabacterium cuenoti]
MKNVLISVYQKNEKLLEFVSFLSKKEYQIISTSGTYHFLMKNGFSPIEVSTVTSYPEMLDGRVKTIHPDIYAGILANRSIKKHVQSIQNKNIKLIDIVLINFYPFKKMNKKNLDIKSLVEFIDIGGPSLLRAAAKNFFYVTAITDSNDYSLVKDEINYNGSTSLELRRKLAGKVFNLTSIYDTIISNSILEENFSKNFPFFLNFSFEKKFDLRYGENPHQKAAFYVNNLSEDKKGIMHNFRQLHGKKLSFNNIRDMDIAWKIVNQFSNPTCCIVKHSTPCGVATGKNVLEAFKKTYYADPVSSFGGVIAFNYPISKTLALEINKIFLELIIAPNYELNTNEILQSKKNLRIIILKDSISDKLEFVQVDGGLLIQQSDYFLNNKENYKIVTKKKFSDEEVKSLFFAQKVVKYVKSNAIVIASETQTLGISGGQTNRIWAAKAAISRALEKKKKRLVLVSDAFFPFRDIIDEVAHSGSIQAILQPGGSIRDEESIKACNDYGIAMAFTGKRYFKH